MLSMLGKKSADDIMNWFYSYVFQKIGFDIICKLSPQENLHEMSDPIFWGKKNKKNIISLSSAEFAQRVVKVKKIVAVIAYASW